MLGLDRFEFSDGLLQAYDFGTFGQELNTGRLKGPPEACPGIGGRHATATVVLLLLNLYDEAALATWDFGQRAPSYDFSSSQYA
eukprot:evm.model.NODE_15635_length_12772_cov_48.864784.2